MIGVGRVGTQGHHIHGVDVHGGASSAVHKLGNHRETSFSSAIRSPYKPDHGFAPSRLIPAAACRHEVAFEPLARQPRHLIQRAGLFEEVRGAGDDHELLFAAELRERRPVQLDDLKVVPPDDEQRGRPDARQGRPSQIRTPAPRDDRAHHLGRSAAATSAAAAPVLAPK